ncbi:MAG: ATP-binding protein [Planctomycetota bacterium]|jgi:CO dehydrogenase maturation factor
MAITVAISGKGGSGKTTLAAMIIRILIERCGKSVLAVDADPNSCLGLTMGVEVGETVAKVREKVRTKENEGMDRVRSFEYGVQQAITEAEGFDLLTMGQPEGPACYCAANNLLRKFLDQLSDAYSFVVIDNEAGMEHLSRRTTNNVDLLCIVAEPTPIGEITAKRIFGLAKTLPITIKQAGVIWNRTDNIKDLDGIESFGFVPYDETVFNASVQSKTIFDIKMSSPAFLSVQGILEKQLELKVNI